jgi:hypothetical protein
MVLAYDQIRADTDRSPQPTMDSANCEMLECEPRDPFAGVANWPNIDASFQAESLAVIATHGIPSWVGRGGVMRDDGRLSFGAWSSIALEILREFWESAAGFHWVDDEGTDWAVVPCPSGRGDSKRVAFAMSWHRSGWLLDRRARRRAIGELLWGLNALDRRGRTWSAEDRAVQSQLARVLRRLQRADFAIPLLVALSGRYGTIEITAVDLQRGVARFAAPTPSLSFDEIWAATCSLAVLQIAELRFGRWGWDPQIVRQSAAVTDLARISGESSEFQIAPLWRDAVVAFSDVERVGNRSRRDWGGARQAKPPSATLFGNVK